jgi:hypothetical protein
MPGRVHPGENAVGCMDCAMMGKKTYLLEIMLALLLAVSGCGQGESQPGVVARINGDPIYLSELKSGYDLHYMDWSSSNDFDVESLRSEYGAVLGDMILQILIQQTLIQEGLAVTNEDVAKAEATIRADYPPEVFEQTLLEEYIDIEQWRKWLRARLSMEKFVQEYLRPNIVISYEAAREYYQEHIADFLVPERFVFTLFEGKERETLVAASHAYQKNGTVEHEERFSGVQIHELDVPSNALSPTWSDLLAPLAPGQSSKILAGKSGMTLLCLKKREPETILSPLAAYPAIEKILMDTELKNAFADWLKRVSSSAAIEVTPLLQEIEGKKKVVSSSGNENAT